MARLQRPHRVGETLRLGMTRAVVDGADEGGDLRVLDGGAEPGEERRQAFALPEGRDDEQDLWLVGQWVGSRWLDRGAAGAGAAVDE